MDCVREFYNIIDKVVYLVLLCLGIYFIYQGGVVQRFHMKRTNFAEYSEPMTELPTIIIWIRTSSRGVIRYQRDVNISYWHDGVNTGWSNNRSVSLSLGRNWFSSGQVGWHLEELGDYYGTYKTLRLSPLTYTSGLAQDFTLTINFEEQAFEKELEADQDSDFKMESVGSIGFVVSTANNSACGLQNEWKKLFQDGDIHYIASRLSHQVTIRVIPVKYIFSEVIENCRTVPYHQMELNAIMRNIHTNCTRPCIPQDYWICKNGIKVNESLPTCNTTDVDCFWKAQESLSEAIIQKPCTKLQYEIETITKLYRTPYLGKYSFEFPRHSQVIVKEEYVIYDFVALISSIGGTMGLCIGFSFTDTAKSIKEMIRNIMEKIREK